MEPLSKENHQELPSNLDSAVLMLLTPLPESATKTELHTRIATIKLKQAQILGHSEYAAKQLEAAMEAGSSDRTSHQLLQNCLSKLQTALKTNNSETGSAGAPASSSGAKSNIEKAPDKKQQNEENNDKKSEDTTTEDAARQLDQLRRESAKLQEQLERRLWEEIHAIQGEQESLEKRQNSIQKRLRSLDASIEENLSRQSLSRTKLLDAIAGLRCYNTTSIECSVCHDQPAVRAVIPCGHQCLCDSCTQSIAASSTPLCPLCRGGLLSTLKIYTTK